MFRLLHIVMVGCLIGTGLLVYASKVPECEVFTVDNQTDQLKVSFSVQKKRVPTAAELVFEVAFVNKSKDVIKLNGLFLEIPKVLLQVRRADGTPVNPGSPPQPPKDDGKTGRIVLEPGKDHTFIYAGSDYFGTGLASGKYQARFRYQNKIDTYGDWTGSIVTEWIEFEIGDD